MAFLFIHSLIEKIKETYNRPYIEAEREREEHGRKRREDQRNTVIARQETDIYIHYCRFCYAYDTILPCSYCGERMGCGGPIITYQKVTKVDFANNDAYVFSQYCKKTLGMPEKNVRCYNDATYATMLSAVDDIKEIAEAFKGDMNVVFYYAGHGIPNVSSKDAFLLPVDTDGRNTEVCYPLNRLYKELSELNAKSVTVFMDACFSGTQRGEGMLDNARGVALKPKSAEPQGNMVIFTAASDDETAYPYKDKGHGLFTFFLLKKLQDTKGGTTLGELGKYIIDNVSQTSVVNNRKKQTPTVQASYATDNWKNLRLR